jgi:hypothetical protein
MPQQGVEGDGLPAVAWVPCTESAHAAGAMKRAL